MPMDTILSLALAVPLVGATLVALFAVLGVLFRPWIERTHELAETQPRRSLLVGLVNVVSLTALTLALAMIGQNADLGILSVINILLLAAAAVAILFGLAGMVRLVGAHLIPAAGQTRQAVWGGVALVLACLTPYVGWFLLFPYAAMRGLGAFVLAIASRRSARAT
jgi:hypothetical protein